MSSSSSSSPSVVATLAATVRKMRCQAFSREDPSVLVEPVDSATSAVTSMKAVLRCDDVASVVDILKAWLPDGYIRIFRLALKG